MRTLLPLLLSGCAIWPNWGTLDTPDLASCETETLPDRRLRRLSHDAYDHTIRDLLGVESTHGASFAVDVAVEGFLEDAEALVVPPLLADQYRRAAEAIALDEVDLDAVLPCRPEDVGPRDCASAFLVETGSRAFRRPLTTTEHDRYLGLYDEVRAMESFEAGIRWTLAALLQSPHFLYRSELGRRTDALDYALTDWEIASELSYLAWASMPDGELFAAAAAGELSTPEGREAQLERLLADPRAGDRMARFTQSWLHTDRLDSVTRETDDFEPTFTADVRDAMAGELTRFTSDRFLAGDTLVGLFTHPGSFVTDALAEHYGIDAGSAPPDDAGFRPVDLGGTPYAGLLARGALMTTHAAPTGSSPIHRGVVVRERLLCQHLPPPPPDLEISPPDVDPTLTTRERFARHREDEACSGCHDLIDPVGFGFEHFDGVGRWRGEENGRAIDAGGVVHALDGGSEAFTGTDDLGALLGTSVDPQRCYVHQWVRFGDGRADDEVTHCRVDRLTDDFLVRGGRLSDALRVLVGDAGFTQRLGEMAEKDLPVGAPAVALDDEPDGSVDFEDDTGNDDDDTVTAVVDVTNDWGAGYCVNVRVENLTTDTVTWRVELPVDGRIDNAWNTDETDLGNGRYAFEGAQHNREIDPEDDTSFGFCARR
jgi:hypothetical protein